MEKLRRTKSLYWIPAMGVAILVTFAGCPLVSTDPAGVTGTWRITHDPTCTGVNPSSGLFELYADGTAAWNDTGQKDGSWSMTGDTINIWVFWGTTVSFYTGVVSGGPPASSMEGTSRNTTGPDAWCWTAVRYP